MVPFCGPVLRMRRRCFGFSFLLCSVVLVGHFKGASDRGRLLLGGIYGRLKSLVGLVVGNKRRIDGVLVAPTFGAIKSATSLRASLEQGLDRGHVCVFGLGVNSLRRAHSNPSVRPRKAQMRIMFCRFPKSRWLRDLKCVKCSRRITRHASPVGSRCTAGRAPRCPPRVPGPR